MRAIILTKAPTEGAVKTRMQPQYSKKEALELHKQMLETVINKVCKTFNDVWLAVDDEAHPYFNMLRDKHTFTLCNQGGGDLGSRLSNLLIKSFDCDSTDVLFLGSDSPHVSVERYKSAQSALLTHDIAIGPVEDGGYDLLATKICAPELFDNINWGTSSVFQQSMHNIKHLDLSAKVLDYSFDLDRPDDLLRAPPATW